MVRALRVEELLIYGVGHSQEWLWHRPIGCATARFVIIEG